MIHQDMVVHSYKNAPVVEAALSHKIWLNFYQIMLSHSRRQLLSRCDSVSIITHYFLYMKSGWGEVLPTCPI